MKLRLSELVTDLLDRWIPVSSPELPPECPTPIHLQDEALQSFQDDVKQLQAEQIEQLLELYADSTSNLADAELDLEGLL